MSNIEQLLLNRVKLIEDDSWSLIGSPMSLIKDLEAYITEREQEAYQKGYIDGGIGVINGELPFKRQFLSKQDIAQLQSKEEV